MGHTRGQNRFITLQLLQQAAAFNTPPPSPACPHPPHLWAPAPQVLSQLATVEKTNAQLESFCRVDYAAECEAAVNEQIKWVQLAPRSN